MPTLAGNCCAQKTVEDVLGKMEESQEVCKSLQDQNVSLIDKMGTLLERNSLQEQQMQQIGMQHDLEHRLADAKLKQAQAVLEQEQYRHSTEVKEVGGEVLTMPDGVVCCCHLG